MNVVFQRFSRCAHGLAIVLAFMSLMLIAPPAQMQEDETHSLIAFIHGSINTPDAIHTMNPDGSSVHSTDQYGKEIRWSPDGRSILYAATGYDPLDGYYSHIYLLDVASNELQQLTAHDGIKSNARWSPDGNQIAFTNHERSPQDDVYVMRPDGSQLRNVTNTPSTSERLLNWTPDGRLLIELDQNGESGYYYINLDGTGHTPQPMFPSGTDEAAWSPDANLVALTIWSGEIAEIYLMNSDGSDLRNLTQNEAHDRTPTWSPDSQRLAFCSDRDGSDDIYTIRVDGSEIMKLTNSPSYDCAPTWSPLLPGPAPTAGPPTLMPIPVTLTPSALECTDAPPSRLNIGMSAAVIMPTEQEPERQNLRVRDATEGEPLGLLEPGTGFRIVGGPECGAAGQRWWEIETLDGSVRGWSVEGFAPDEYLMVPF